MKESVSINLLRGQNKGFVDKFLTWALTIGRFLVIVTETTALLMFLYRFNLDRQLIDLHDKIKQEGFIVSHLTENEETFRNLQERLSLAQKIDKEAGESAALFQEIYTLGSEFVTIQNLAVEKKLIAIEATSQSINGLQSFVAALKGHPDIRVVSVDKVENKTASAIFAITLTAQLKGGEKETQQEEIPVE